MQGYNHHDKKQNCGPCDEKYVESARWFGSIQCIHHDDPTYRKHIEQCRHE